MTNGWLRKQRPERLLQIFAETLEELRERGLVRSSNNPVADYAEKIAAHALKLRLVGASGAGHDGTDARGKRYQIKGRRVTSHNTSRQLSFMRNLEKKPFDYLVGVIFDADFSVRKACVLPFKTVRSLCGFSGHVNAHRIVLRDEVWAIPGVRDVTRQVTSAARQICDSACTRPGNARPPSPVRHGAGVEGRGGYGAGDAPAWAARRRAILQADRGR